MAIYIEKKDWDKIMYYAKYAADKYRTEISGMLLAKVDKDGDIALFNPTILKQTVSGTQTVLKKEELAKFYVDCYKKEGKDIHFVWWHSHANMDVYFSATDVNTFEEYAETDWSLFLVVNAKGEYMFNFVYWRPIKVKLEKLEITFFKEKEKDIPKSITNAVDECIENPATKMIKYPKSTSWKKGYNSSIPGQQWFACKEFLIEEFEKYKFTQKSYKGFTHRVKKFNNEMKNARYNIVIPPITEYNAMVKGKTETTYPYIEIIKYLEGKNV